MAMTLDDVVTHHRLLSARRCSCGWEGDSATTHVIDAITSAGFTIAKLDLVTDNDVLMDFVNTGADLYVKRED